MKEIIGVQEIIRIIKKHIVLLIILTLFTAGVAGYISYYVITPIYEAQTQILVNQKKNDQEYSWTQMEADLQLINTYNVIITSPIILNKVIRDLNLEVTHNQLAKQISVSNESNSKVLNISIQDSKPQQAAAIANTVASVFQEEIPILMNVDNINILSAAKASENPSPIKPNKMVNIISAAIVGLMAGIGVAFLLEFLDTTIKTEREVAEIIQLPVMGVVCFIDIKKGEVHSSQTFQSKRGERGV